MEAPSASPGRPAPVPAVGIALAYLAFAVAFTWPALPRLFELPLFAVSEHYDALIFLWNFDWMAESLRAGSTPFETTQLFFPDRVSLMLHSNTFVYALLSVPIQLLFEGEAGRNAAYRLCVLASFTVAGWATWQLARRQGLSVAGAFVAGAIFAFCGARLTNLARLHVLGSELVPLALLALCWTLEERRWRGPIALAVCVALLAYNSATLLTIAAMGLLALFAAETRRLAPGWPLRLGAAALATAVAAAPLLPGVLDGLAWESSEAAMGSERVALSLDLAALVWPNANDLVLGGLLPPRPVNALEDYYSFFAGVPVLALAAVALAGGAPLARRGAWLALGGAGLLLALGPEAKWLERPLGVPLPYALLDAWLPPLRISRVPARYVVLVSLALALFAGAGFDAIARRFAWRSPAACVASLLLAAGIALDGTERLPLPTLPALAPDAAALARALEPLPADSAVLDLPYDEHYARRFAMYYQTEHGRPVLFGAYPRAPRRNREHFAESELFRLLASDLAAEPLVERLSALDLQAERERLRALGIGAIALHHGMWHLNREPMRSRMLAIGEAIGTRLVSAWGQPERVPAGFYRVMLFRL